MELIHSGKIRDVYADNPDIILVASDRVSVYDVVLPTPIPDNGTLLTQLSLWWFAQLADVTPNHIISGTVSGIPLPPGLVEGSNLPEPIFTSTTKAAPGAGAGAHDEFITYADVVNQDGADTADQLRRLTLQVYRRGAARAAARGIIIADTKLEFGRDRHGTLTLGDELLTSDSSRFWPANQWHPGRPQFSFDKQYVRDWAAGTGWNKQPPAPTCHQRSSPPPRPATPRCTNGSPAPAGAREPDHREAAAPCRAISRPLHRHLPGML